MVNLKKYPKYKDSGVEWLREVPSEWQVLQIKRLTRVRRGASPRPIDDPIYFDDNGEYSWVRISDVTKSNMYLEETEQKLSNLGSSLSVKLEPGELFLSIAATVGKPCITNVKCCIYDGFVYFPDYRGDKRFLYYIFEAGEAYRGLGKLGTQLNLNTDTVGSIYIAVPTIQEQKMISDFLDEKVHEIDSLIADKEKLIELLEEKRQVIITEAVTKGLNPNVKMKDSGVEWIGEMPESWEVSKIKYQADINKYTLSENTDEDLEIKYIDISSVNSRGEVVNIEKYYFKDAPSRARRILRKGDTIISTVRTYLKAITWFEEVEENLICSTGFAVLSPKETIYPKYLFYLMRSTKYIDEIVKRSIGVSYPAITSTEIGMMECLLPNINEQKMIVEYIDNELKKIDGLVDEIKLQIQKLKEYRQSLIYEAVTGKIDVRDYVRV
ncbi:type I restriction-modification system specificity determinant [Geobacillus kaustophilus HTA426]|uniref:Type I restriction-modification system specificity determinant n=1 Tax=Geobacillus kaustophilus (strain HTA426) TaxID=235909 RepID=Q5KVU6_GEOKA|nr:restriction endonuclease subunit S [Geobacillus kaustophilus]BAD77190.1 type I restriction-modification system specificity determinant [Geobacillus kaustophilus HTA426]